MTPGETAVRLATMAGDERPVKLTGLASAPQDEDIENARGLTSCQLVELYDVANAACKALHPRAPPSVIASREKRSSLQRYHQA